MKLELGNFYVKDIVFGDKTKYEDGILSVNKEECLAFVRRDPHITEADLRIVKPGDMVRLVPVKEAVEMPRKGKWRCTVPWLHRPPFSGWKWKNTLPEGNEPSGCGTSLGRIPGRTDRHGRRGSKVYLFLPA